MSDALYNLKNQVARELGVQIGSKEHNRNQSVAYFGQVGGEMVRRALAQAWGTSTEASYNTPTITPTISNFISQPNPSTNQQYFYQ